MSKRDRQSPMLSPMPPGRKNSLFMAAILLLLALPFPVQAEEQLFLETLALARQGDGEAQFSLALMYDTGNLVERNPKQAVHWFAKAAAAGITGACFYLGMKYEFGVGIGRDTGKALHWYRQAAVRGWPQAAFFLANLLLNGPDRDLVHGCGWLDMAARQGYPGAGQILEEQCSGMDRETSRQAQAFIQQIRNGKLVPDPTAPSSR